jgi:hypothetical protein
MLVRWSEAHKVAVIDPQARLDVRTMVEIKNTIGSLLRDGCRTVILDCQGVERMQAMSLGVLVERLCRAREAGGAGGAPRGLALPAVRVDLRGAGGPDWPAIRGHPGRLTGGWERRSTFPSWCPRS